MIPHSPCEIEPIHVGMLNVWKIAELLPERALPTKAWRQYVTILKSEPSKNCCAGIISAFVHVLDCFPGSTIPLFEIILLLAYIVKPRIECVLKCSFKQSENQSGDNCEPKITKLRPPIPSWLTL